MRHLNVDLLYVPTDLKKNKTRMLKSLSILEKMHPDNLLSMCLADFVSS